MHLKELRLRGFQSHADTRLEFSDGINFIVGDSTVGKTSVIRAVQFLLSGRPQSPIWASGDKVSVEAVFTNGDTYKIVKTLKNGKVVGSKYFVNETEYSTGKPPELFLLSDINIQSQFEPFYLLSLSNGDITRKVQEITGVELADKIRSALNSGALELSREEKNILSRLAEINNELSLIPDLKELEKHLCTFERIETKILEQESRKEKLLLLEKKIIFYEGEIARLTSAVESAASLVGELETTCNRLEKLKNVVDVINRFDRLAEYIEELKKDLSDLENAYVKKLVILGVCPVCGSAVSEKCVREKLKQEVL